MAHVQRGRSWASGALACSMVIATCGASVGQSARDASNELEPSDPPATPEPTDNAKEDAGDNPASESPDGGPEEATELAKARRRAEFLALAPFLGLNNPLALEDAEADALRQNFDRVSALKEYAFESGPLRQVGPALRSFLDERRKFVAPLIVTAPPEVKAQAAVDLAVRGEVTGEVLLAAADLWSRWLADARLRSWQAECDQRLRKDFDKLLPVAREVAGPPATGGTGLIRMDFSADGWRIGRIVAEHAWEKPLTNATLIVVKISADGRSMRHHYFVPEWAPRSPLNLRPAGDWTDVGGANTIGGTVELLSDQVRSSPKRFVLENNAKMTIPRVVEQMKRRTLANPAWVKARARAMEAALSNNPGVPDEVAMVRELLRDARDAVEAKAKALTDQIRAREKRAEELRMSPDREREGRADNRRNELAKVLAEIKKLRAEREQLLRE